MAFMPWTQDLELGLAEIDRQHHWLVDLTNALYDEISRPDPRPQVVGQVLEGLVDYTYNHFVAEEVLLLQYGYPETEDHRAEHDAFTSTATKLLLRFEAGERVEQEALEFLKQWLVHHICQVDRAYAPFLKAQGVK